MRFSIVIPIYNVEEYLNECVESILSQTYTDYEVVLVDDGSTDKSGDICDSYKNYTNVKVIHKDNGGLSSARNAGLEVASGEYIIFLDSDDCWTNRNCLNFINEAVLQTACEVLVWKSKKFVGAASSVKLKRETGDIKTINPKVDAISDYSFRSCGWDKAIRSDFYRSFIPKFELGVLSEDVTWSYEILVHATSISFLDKVVVAYRQRSGSITKKKNDEKAKYMIKHLNSLIALYSKMEDGMLKMNAGRYIAEQYANALISGGGSKTIKDNQEFLKKNIEIIKLGQTKKCRYISASLKLIGILNTSKLCGLILKMKTKV